MTKTVKNVEEDTVIEKDTEEVCNKGMSFEECEIAILNASIEKGEYKLEKRLIERPEVKKMITIIENYLKNNDNTICYGGQAINQVLPEEDRFYGPTEIPDYDFFSYNALETAKDIADTYYKNGYIDVEAKPGVHHGTFKVFVNYLAVADITQIPKELFMSIKKEAIQVEGIYYAPPNYLRMAMYLELSRPAGDLSRWEKVLKRLKLLNKNYPEIIDMKSCNNIQYQRDTTDSKNDEKIFHIVKDTLIDENVVFFGGYALLQYSKYMEKREQRKIKKIPDFDVLSNHPEKTAKEVKKNLENAGFTNIIIHTRPAVGEIIPEQIAVSFKKQHVFDTIVVVYKPVACHAYNTIDDGDGDGDTPAKKIRIATIDTMLSFYLAFLYANKPYYDVDRIACMARFLYNVQEHNKLSQKGLLRRFTITCLGHQESKEDMKRKKSKMYEKLKGKEGTSEYEEWFLNYHPSDKTHTHTNTHTHKKHRTHRNRLRISTPRRKTKKTMWKLFSIKKKNKSKNWNNLYKSTF